MDEKRQMSKAYLSLKELSEHTGLSYDSLRHRVRKEGLPGLRRLGRRLFVHVREFDASCKKEAE